MEDGLARVVNRLFPGNRFLPTQIRENQICVGPQSLPEERAHSGVISGGLRYFVNLPFGRRYDVIRRKPEFLLKLFEGR